MRCDATVSVDGNASPTAARPSNQAVTDATGHFTISAPVGQSRITCMPLGGEPISFAGTDVTVATNRSANVTVYAVRAAFAAPTVDPGFMLAPLTLPLTIGDVRLDGAEALAGLRVGDRLITLDGAQLQGLLPHGAMILMSNKAPGSTVTLAIERSGNAQVIKLPLKAPNPQ